MLNSCPVIIALNARGDQRREEVNHQTSVEGGWVDDCAELVVSCPDFSSSLLHVRNSLHALLAFIFESIAVDGQLCVKEFDSLLYLKAFNGGKIIFAS